MPTILQSFYANGSPVDPTSAVMSNQAATQGVIRNDTGALVAGGTAGLAMTRISTGQYSYTWGDPANDLTYTWYADMLYGGNHYYFTGQIAGSATPNTNFGMTWLDLYTEIAYSAFNTRSPSASQITQVKTEAIVGAGRFYAMREWSFLKPAATLYVTSGALATDLPANYRSNCYDFHFNTSMPTLRRVEVGDLMTMRTATQSSGGVTVYYAIRPKLFVAQTGQRFEVLFYPVPAQAMTLACQFTVNPAKPVNDTDYLPGGPQHDQTILYAALAYHESISGKTVGPMESVFQSLLQRSIDMDAQTRETNLGDSRYGQGPSMYDLSVDANREQPYSVIP